MKDFISAGEFERKMLNYEKDIDRIVFADYMKDSALNMVSDIASILKQVGYTKGAEIFERMFGTGITQIDMVFGDTQIDVYLNGVKFNKCKGVKNIDSSYEVLKRIEGKSRSYDIPTERITIENEWIIIDKAAEEPPQDADTLLHGDIGV